MEKLVEVPMKEPLQLDLPSGTYIAGGYALYLAGYSNSYGDHDIFVTSDCKLSMPQLLETLGIIEYDESEFAYTYHKNIFDDRKTCGKLTIVDKLSSTVQVIKKIRKSPYDIVSSFDLDICQFIFDGKRLWATQRALYAANHKKLYIVPENVRTMEYTYNRARKYMRRGYKLLMPGIEKDKIDL